MSELRDLFEQAHVDHLKFTQNDVMKLHSLKPPFKSALLGNELRESTADALTRFARTAQGIVADLQGQLLRLAEADDSEIFTKAVLLGEQSAP